MIHPCAAPTKLLGDIPLLSSTGLILFGLLNHLGGSANCAPGDAKASRNPATSPTTISMHAVNWAIPPQMQRPQRCTTIRLVPMIVGQQGKRARWGQLNRLPVWRSSTTGPERMTKWDPGNPDPDVKAISPLCAVETWRTCEIALKAPVHRSPKKG